MDDSYSEYSPVLLNGLENFYAGKGCPTYCIYQVAGMPTLSMSTYSFLYPITHLSYLISKYLLQDVYHFNDVFALIHLFIGYLLFYKFLKQQGIPPVFSLTGTLLFTFCGFNLMGIRSQYYIAPTVLFLPLLFFLALRWNYFLYTWSRILILIAILIVYIYSGNIQFFTYTMFFFSLFVMFNVNKEKRWKNVSALVIVSAITLVIFSPMAIAVKNETEGLVRSGRLGCGILSGLIPLFGVPLDARMPCHWGAHDLYGYNAQFYHGAGILITLTFISFVYKLRAAFGRISKILLRPTNGLYWLFLFAFLSSVGRMGLLWAIQAELPVISSFTLPFKYLLFIQFFGVIIGIRIVVILLRKIKWKTSVMIMSFLAFQFFYLFWHIYNTRQAFYVFTYEKPYPKADWLSKCDNSGLYRIVPLFPWRSDEEKFETSMALNFATHYKQMSTYVYEPLLIHNLPDFEKYYPQYGVRYFVISKHESVYSWENDKDYFYHNLLKLYKNWQKLDTIYEDKDVLIFENRNYSEMLEVYDKEGKKMECSFKMNEMSDGVEYVLNPKTLTSPRRIMINFFRRKAHRVWLDGKEVPVNEDRFKRIEVSTDKVPHRIRMKYDPFF